MTAALVEAGIRVYEVRPIEQSLEEIFFQLTGTSAHATLDDSVPKERQVA